MSIAAYQGVCPTCRHDHSAPIPALASGSGDHPGGVTDMIGSGDHAELARKPVAWRWRYKGTNWIFGAEKPSWPEDEDEVVEPLFGEALLAENAALRAERTFLIEQKEGAEDALFDGLSRATEAERKLAEAEDENTRWAFRFAEVREAAGIGVKPMLSEVPGEIRKMRERLNEIVRDIAETPYTGADWPRERARTFLSKEAERG